MTKVNPIIQLWKTQKKPILFFGFIIIAIGLGFYSNHNNIIVAKKWSQSVTAQIAEIETESTVLIKTTEVESKKNQIQNLLNKIQLYKKTAQSLDDQVVAKSYNLKTYYISYLDINQKNLNKIKVNIEQATKLDNLNNWEMRIKSELESLASQQFNQETIQNSKSKINLEYQKGKDLINKMETYIKESTDTVLIGKLVASQDYYRGIINWLDGLGWIKESSSTIPTQAQLQDDLIKFQELTAKTKPVGEVLSQITTSSIFSGEIISTKNNIIKIIKKVNE